MTDKEQPVDGGKKKLITRRQARRLALQILFTNEFLKEDLDTVANRVGESLDMPVSNFCRQLYRQTSLHIEELDRIIEEGIKTPSRKQIIPLEKILLRMAVTELLYFPDIPVEVTMDETLEICKDFNNFRDCRFINGVLDSIYKDLEKQGKISKNLAARIPPPSKRK